MGKNLEHNKKVFERYKKAPGEKAIFSRDGFIEHQHGMDDAKYGNVTVKHGGCGAIAVWNILKFLGFRHDEAQIFDEMEKGVILGGKLGTEVFFVKKYLSQKGCRVGTYLSLKEFMQSASHAGILYFINENFKAHYVAFTPAGVNDKGEFLYRFHNATAGSYWKTYNGIKYIENLPLTISDFLTESNAKVKVFYDVYK